MALETLKAVLRYKKVSYRQLASDLDIQVSTFSNKINEKGGSEFSRKEMLALAERLELTPEDVVKYFFASLLA